MCSAIECCVIIVLCWFTLSFRETGASYGDSCTPQNVTNCTQPQLICSKTEICVCSQGYIPDPEQNGTTCRLPGYDEPCNAAGGCQESMNCDNVSGSMRCQCYSTATYYYDPLSGQCKYKPNMNDRCDVNIGCVNFSQCVATLPAPPTCQCNSSDLFIDDITSMCLPVSYLAADVTSVTVTASKVTFTWDERSPESGIGYDIEWTPRDGRIDDEYPLGGQVSGLHSGTLYNFTIKSWIGGSSLQSERYYYGPNITVCTEALYGEQCGVCGTCQDTSTSCLEAEDGQFHCLCNITSFNSTTAGNCLPLEELLITNLSSVVTATTATITWSTRYLSPFLKYMLTWTPTGGKLDSINSTWARVTGLTSRTFYDFIISSVLASDGLYPEKNVASLGITMFTKPAFNESCNATIGCQDNQHCVNQSGKMVCQCGSSSEYYDVSKDRCLRKPAFNESCNVTIGCQDYQHCVNQSGKIVCQCVSSSEYYDVTKDQCLGRPTLNEPCDVTIDCEEFYQCVGTPPTCQCNSSGTFFDSFSYQCLQINDVGRLDNGDITQSDVYFSRTLKMRDQLVSITSITMSSTTVNFTWQLLDEEIFADYALVWTPNRGQVSYISTEGSAVSGLEPGTQYIFSVVAEASGKKHFGPNVTVCTGVLYSGDCSICTVCQDNATTCMTARDRKQRCLCGNRFYNKIQTGNCSPLNDLAVVDISSTSTTTTSNLSWTARTWTDSETFHITWHQAGVVVEAISRTGCRVSGLSPGVVYLFSITSRLPADIFNDAKNVTSMEYFLKTQVAYLGNCTPDTDEDCQDKTSCIQSMEGNFMCMCDNSSFFSGLDNSCFNLQYLQVTNISATFTATTATLSWTANQQHPSTTQLTIDWTPKGGRLDRISSTGCHISELNPETEYNFTIVSTLPPDRYYPLKSVYNGFSLKTLNTSPSSPNNKVQIDVGVGVGCAVLFIIVVVGVVCYKRRRPDIISTRLQEYSAEDQAVNAGYVKSYVPGHYSRVQPVDSTEAPRQSNDDISLENMCSTVHNIDDQESPPQENVDIEDFSVAGLRQ